MAISMTCPSCGKRLSAPDTAAGKRAKCPACGTIMPIPDTVIHDAEEIGAEEIAGSSTPPYHQPAPVDDNPLAGLYDESAAPPPTPGTGEARRPCPMCREMIVASAAKCRHCGAVLDPSLRALEKKNKASLADTKLDPGEWVLCILCANIGCIVGVIYAIQGKPKGAKMIMVSVIANVVGFIIGFVIQVLSMAVSGGPRHMPGPRRF